MQRIGADRTHAEDAGPLSVESPSDPGGRPSAPGALGRIEAFVNTIDLRAGRTISTIRQRCGHGSLPTICPVPTRT